MGLEWEGKNYQKWVWEWEGKKLSGVDTELRQTHSNALEHTNDRQNYQLDGMLCWPIRPVRWDKTGYAERRVEPSTSSLGETPSELKELGLLWDRSDHLEHFQMLLVHKTNNKLVLEKS